MEATQKGCRCVTFLGNFVVDVDTAKRDCGGSATDGRRNATHDKRRKSPCVFARGGLGDGEGYRARLKRIVVEEDGQVFAVSVGVEVVSDVRYVVTSFLEDHHVEVAAGGTEDLCGPMLLVHEIAIRIGERDVKFGPGNTKA